MLDTPVGVEGEPALGPRMDWIGPLPWPPTELCAVVVDHCLAQLLVAVHHERSHLEHGRTDRHALEEKELCRSAVVRHHGLDGAES